MPENSNPFLHRLMQCLGTDEGRAVYREICREMDAENHTSLPNAWSEDARNFTEKMVSGIEEGKPLQYLLRKAWFMGLELEVNPSVLIPRPETEELVSLILKTGNQSEKKLLDLCTGSGCIAIANRKLGSWKSVEALDLSKEALLTAQRNLEKLHAEVSLFHFDLLQDVFPVESRWDIWVSNPPYVALSESAEMDSRVLNHEPHIALFVPDDDALCFYRRILELSKKHLNSEGKIFLEINPVYSKALFNLYQESGLFSSVKLHPDMSGKVRFLIAEKGA